MVLASSLQSGKQGKMRRSSFGPRKIEKLAALETAARTLARSGKYRGYKTVEMALVASGFANAAEIFTNRWTCSEINRLCEQAQRQQRVTENQT
jgi:hypothetical protein